MGQNRRALVQGKTPFVEGAMIEDDDGSDLSPGSRKGRFGMIRLATVVTTLLLAGYGGSGSPAPRLEPPAPPREVRIVDADTIDIDGTRYRLHGIDVLASPTAAAPSPSATGKPQTRRPTTRPGSAT